MRPVTGKVPILAAGAEEARHLGARDTGFLRLVADVHLDHHLRPAVLLRHGFGDGLGELRAVQALDDVGQPHGVARLVGLQPADDVKPQGRVAFAQRRELLPRLLDAVLAEDRLAGGQRGDHRLGGVCLGDGDQRDFRGVAAGSAGGGLDSRADSGEALGDVVGHAP
jgi:hypothetical protein